MLGVAVRKMAEDIVDRRRGSCRRRRAFTGGLPGRTPPAAAASLGSGCELAPRGGNVKDGRTLIGLIGARSPRFFSRQFAELGLLVYYVSALVKLHVDEPTERPSIV